MIESSTSQMIDGVLFQNAGYCHCCRKDTMFVAHGSWLRDHYVCRICSSIPRQRHIQLVLDEFYPGWEKKTIHEAAPANKNIAQHASNYSCSQYLPEAKLGSCVGGMRCEDIEQLSFKDRSIDIFITQDVLEHVFHPDTALREITRVLRPGGIHIFTTPKCLSMAQTVQRARWRDGHVEHLAPEEYHGSPVGDGQSLVTFTYGADFELLASEWSGRTVQTFNSRNRKKGIDGDFSDVFVIAA